MSKQRKRILQFTPFMDHGGTERHLYSLITYLTTDHDIYLCSPEGSMFQQFQSLDVKYLRYPGTISLLPSIYRRTVSRLDQVIRASSPDLIHIHACREIIYAIKRMYPRIPLVFTPHIFLSRLDFVSTALFCRLADAVICVSGWEKGSLLRYGFFSEKYRGRLYRIYNGTPLADINGIDNTTSIDLMDRDLENSEIVVGVSGRLVRDKAIALVIQAVSKLRSKYLQLQLVIVGDGDDRERLEQMSKDLGLEDRIRFTGRLNSPIDEVSRFDIFAHPSLNEGLSMAIIEAMALGKPVVSTRVGGTPEVVAHGETGLLVEPNNLDQFISALDLLIGSKIRRQQMGEAGRLRAIRLFSANSMSRETEALYQSLYSG